jgi:rubredoxin
MLPFRLKVHKFKCILCDLIFLVDDLPHYDVMWSCPHCNGSHVERMDRISIVQEYVK